MSELHPNVVTYLAAIDAFNRQDLKAVGDYVRPDFRYRIPGRSRVAGEFRGIESFVEALTRLRDESAGTIQLTPVAVLADDENLIASARVTAQRDGKRLDTENCYAFRFRDGKVAGGQVILSDPDHVEDFWGSHEQAAIVHPSSPEPQR
jgi:ketosteroid isomerase-like protein